MKSDLSNSKGIGMKTTRLEAFSDGVLAIILTIMVLDLRIPHDPSLSALLLQWPVFLSYMLSFVYVGIYWNNHHHMLYATERVNGRVLWANLHLLFWLSLVPFATGWMGETVFAAAPAAFYGVILLMAAFAYSILQHCIIVTEGQTSILARAVGRDWKGKISPFLYLCGIGSSFLYPGAALAFYFLVALLWLAPDRRIEKIVLE